MTDGCQAAYSLPSEGMTKGSPSRLDRCTVEGVFQEYWHKVTSWLQRMVGSRDIADELTQEAYLRLVSASTSQFIEHPRAFLYQTARNLAVDHVRKVKLQAAVACLDEALEVPSEEPSAEQALSDRQQLNRFIASVDSMPARAREVFLLHRVDELSYRQIADRLRISESAVEKNMMRALSHCRRMLADDC